MCRLLNLIWRRRLPAMVCACAAVSQPIARTDGDILAVAPWAQTVVLVGNVGSELWDKSGAEIAALGDPDPLDRWTRSVIEPIASSVDGLALFPFAGPPYWPFQRWAERAEGVRSSPIGIQIHPEFGLWHAYRAAILLRGQSPCRGRNKRIPAILVWIGHA